MKADVTDVSTTRKTLAIEVPADIVGARIERAAREYGRRTKIPGFRPGKAPARVVKQRFLDQILHDVVHDLVPQAVDEAARERGLEPVSQPDVRDVHIADGQPLTFNASFDTLPPFDLGSYEQLSVIRPSDRIEDDAVDRAMQRLQDRAARYEPVEGRGVVDGDIVMVDLERTSNGSTDAHADVALEMGASANPPGFDAHLLGLEPGARTEFSITFPADYAAEDLAGKDVQYIVAVKSLKRRVVPALDDEFAKDMGQFDSLHALRTRVREDLEHEAKHAVERAVRGELMKQLAAWIPFEIPESLIEREIDRRMEEFAGRLMDQNIDPRQAGVDWGAFRGGQRDAAKEAVASTLVLDAVARREALVVDEAEVEQEIARYADRTGRTPAAVRAALDKDGGVSRVRTGLRREKSVDFVMARARIQGN